ncbi:MAG: DUF1559 domain-containing protein [Phycisphaerae bacterium]|nr:DUF1559 domain-containing protein [Phycisphaerae bacterium]
MAVLPEARFDPKLLDLHLGELSDGEAGELRARLEADPQLAEQHAILTSVFAALESVRGAEAAPADLGRRIAARVAATPRLSIAKADAELREQTERTQRPLIIPFSNLRDIVAVAAMVVLAVGLGLPGLLNVRERGQRIACSANLAQIGSAVQQYANAFDSSLPFVGWNQGENTWLPTDDPDVQTLPNRRHVYPLLRGRYVRPTAFICPSRMHVAMRDEQIDENDDFLESRNVSYAYQNMAGVRPSAEDLPALPLLSDENPLFQDGLPLFDALRQGLSSSKRNSPAHRSAGQNILSLSGHVQWVTTPTVGIKNDNIWTLRDVTEYTGREGPSSVYDSQMLK